eukprot:COSAG01_NODE_27020_length_696_cov_3.164154_1_plen_49_part_10
MGWLLGGGGGLFSRGEGGLFFCLDFPGGPPFFAQKNFGPQWGGGGSNTA